MAHTGIFATSDEILVKTGEDYNSNAGTEARINKLCLQIEGILNTLCKYNFSDAYAGLNADVQGILASAQSAWVAAKLINYDWSGFNSRFEAQGRILVNMDEYEFALSLLKDKIKQKFMREA